MWLRLSQTRCRPDEGGFHEPPLGRPSGGWALPTGTMHDITRYDYGRQSICELVRHFAISPGSATLFEYNWESGLPLATGGHYYIVDALANVRIGFDSSETVSASIECDWWMVFSSGTQAKLHFAEGMMEPSEGMVFTKWSFIIPGDGQSVNYEDVIGGEQRREKGLILRIWFESDPREDDVVDTPDGKKGTKKSWDAWLKGVSPTPGRSNLDMLRGGAATDPYEACLFGALALYSNYMELRAAALSKGHAAPTLTKWADIKKEYESDGFAMRAQRTRTPKRMLLITDVLGRSDENIYEKGVRERGGSTITVRNNNAAFKSASDITAVYDRVLGEVKDNVSQGKPTLLMIGKPPQFHMVLAVGTYVIHTYLCFQIYDTDGNEVSPKVRILWSTESGLVIVDPSANDPSSENLKRKTKGPLGLGSVNQHLPPVKGPDGNETNPAITGLWAVK